eukprot:COSAG02_NODE_1466_length_12483_cov_37.157703_11_plen_113_part_00
MHAHTHAHVEKFPFQLSQLAHCKTCFCGRYSLLTVRRRAAWWGFGMVALGAALMSVAASAKWVPIKPPFWVSNEYSTRFGSLGAAPPPKKNHKGITPARLFKKGPGININIV